jgi:UDP-N-acetylmuramate dehydrogenase
MNAGTYLGQIGDIVEVVNVITHDGRRLDMTPDDLQFRYRWSVFQADSSKIIAEVAMRLKPGNKEDLVQAAESIRARRGTNLPNGRSAGCVFKNPGGEKSAGQLIDLAGLKGMSVGDAVVADKHANFIVNNGNASAAEVRALAEQVRGIVRSKFDVELIYEVRIVGDW